MLNRVTIDGNTNQRPIVDIRAIPEPNRPTANKILPTMRNGIGTKPGCLLIKSAPVIMNIESARALANEYINSSD